MLQQNTSRFCFYLLLFLLVSFSSCQSYRSNIMFQTEKDVQAAQLQASMADANKNYVIQPNDQLDVQVYTNKGERIIDPNLEYFKIIGRGTNTQMLQQQVQPQYIVQQDGRVNLPMLGLVKLAGMSIMQADSFLQKQYAPFYVDAFVITRVKSNRVFVLGAPGGKVIPLTYENMNMIEVLALAGGISNEGKAQNIRLIRGDLKEPVVQVVDLSTIDGMRKASLAMEPNDIIYIEPVRRPVPESLRDILPVLSLISSTIGLVTTTILILDTLK